MNSSNQLFEENMPVVLKEISKQYSDKKKLEEISKKFKSNEDKEQ